MATRKQSDPRAALGDLFASPDDRKPAPLRQLGDVPGEPGFWGWQDRQRYVDSKPGTKMHDLYSTATQERFKQINADIDVREKAKKAARDAQRADDRRRRY